MNPMKHVAQLAVISAIAMPLPVIAQTVLEYNFDGNLNDSSGQGLHGTWTGGGSPMFSMGPDGTPCVYLDGNHYVRRTVNDPQLRLGALTVEAYIYTDSVSGKHQIVDFRQSNGGYNLRTYGYSGQWGFQVSGYEGYWLSTGGGLSPGRWFVSGE
jgi:hypothetical protein